MTLAIALLIIVAVAAFGMGFILGQSWQGHCERLLNPRAGAWEGTDD